MWYKIGLSRMVIKWKMGEEDSLVEVNSYIMVNQPGASLGGISPGLPFEVVLVLAIANDCRSFLSLTRYGRPLGMFWVKLVRA